MSRTVCVRVSGPLACFSRPEMKVERVSYEVMTPSAARGVLDAILWKPGKLTAEEFEEMKRHTIVGGQILAGGRSPLLNMAQQIALHHHERWDGAGYCGGLREHEIPLAARIAGTADVYDTLTHVRPYKDAWPTDEAIAEICRQSGRQFDPAIAEALRGAVGRELTESKIAS